MSEIHDMEDEMHVMLDNCIASANRMTAAIARAEGKIGDVRRLREALTEASKQFTRCAHRHLEKDPPDMAEAAVCDEWAEKCFEAARE